MTITCMINEMIKINPKFEKHRSILYRKSKKEVEKIYRKVLKNEQTKRTI